MQHSTESDRVMPRAGDLECRSNGCGTDRQHSIAALMSVEPTIVEPTNKHTQQLHSPILVSKISYLNTSKHILYVPILNCMPSECSI